MTVEGLVSALGAAVENNSAIEARDGDSVLFDGVEKVTIHGNTVTVDFDNGLRADICVSVFRP